MKAWEVTSPGPLTGEPLRYVERDAPEPRSRQILVRISSCGVCRTDLHVVEGDLPMRKKHVIPGHEVVGVVERTGSEASRFAIGKRVGIPWLRSTCGICRFCTRDDENLCIQPRFTGYDEDGGYAELAVAHEDFAHEVPDVFDDIHAAPLLCAGIIGYRALKRAHLSRGGRLGIYGFGGSAHIAAQVALYQGATVHVMTRAEEARELARDLGVASVQGAYDSPPEPLDASILFAPVGDLVPVAMEGLDAGGRLSIAGIHLSDIPGLDYQRHLFREREIASVTANTRKDAREFLDLAARIPVEVTVRPYALDQANLALRDLAGGRIAGAAVLEV